MKMENLSPAEKKVAEAALKFAQKHKTEIAKQLTDVTLYPPELIPVSVFMAGSPGAGKTEASIALLESFGGGGVLRLDPDELRTEFQRYTGDNSWLFQPAISVLVDKIHDLLLKNGQSFLLDGTLTNYDKAKQNIERSLKRVRWVQILYVYQEPAQAWQFVTAREKAEGRQIRPETFVEQYFAARKVVNQLKIDFGKDIQIDLLLKNNDGSTRVYKDNIEKIDPHVPERYTVKDIEQIVGLT